MKLQCHICGNTDVNIHNKDIFCNNCKNQYHISRDQITQCPNCGEWHFKTKNCNCKPTPKYTKLPSEGFEECILCGNPSFGYAFCSSCYNSQWNSALLDILNGCIEEHEDTNNKIIKCPDCGTWRKQNEICSCDIDIRYNTLPTKGFEHCIICNAESYGNAFCINCWQEHTPDELIDTLNKNTHTCILCGKELDEGHLCTECFNKAKLRSQYIQQNLSPQDLKDYYFRTKDELEYIENFDQIQQNCIDLFSIAAYQNSVQGDSYLLARVCRDIDTLIKNAKKPKAKKAIFILPTDEKNASNKNAASKCLICNNPAEHSLFCPSCFNKYKNKELFLRITKCANIELLDEDYEGKYTCKDGHITKSKSEREIDDFLFDHNIKHAYEKELYYGSNETDFIRPDFYLPDYLGKNKHVYIEHWGYSEENEYYAKIKKFKMNIYQKLGITLVCTFEKTDTKKINTVLERKLNRQFIKENQINE